MASCNSNKSFRRVLATVAVLLTATVLLMAVVISLGFFSGPAPEEAFRQSLAALERGELAGVENSLAILDRHPAFSAHVRLLEGIIFLRGQRREAALSRFLPIPLTGSLRPYFLVYAAQTLYELSRLADAEVLLQGLVKEQPDHAEAHRWLAIIYYDLGAFGPAIESSKRVVDLSPHDYRPHRLIGLMYHDFEQDSDAVSHYHSALELSPPQSVKEEMFGELAESLVNLRRYDEVQEVVRQAAPTAVLCVLAGQAAWSMGQTDEARQFLSQAYGLDANERRLFLLDAQMRTAAGDIPAALTVLRKGAVQHPHDAETRYRLALALRELGFDEESETEMAHWRKAKDLATKLTELNVKAVHDPRDPVVREELAEICTILGKDEMAAMWRRAAAACRMPAGP